MSEEQDEIKRKEAEKAELIRLSYAIEKIRTLLVEHSPDRYKNEIAKMKSDVTQGLEGLKLALKLIGQMLILHTLCGRNTDIDLNIVWERWSRGGHSEFFNEFYYNNYNTILETPERIVELFQEYQLKNPNHPPFNPNLDITQKLEIE